MQRLWALTHALHARSKRMESQLGVTSPQRLALRLVGRMPGVSARVLADALRLHPSTLTGVLKRLEEAGLLTRAVDANDARKSRIELTARGKQIDRERAGTVEAAVRRAIARVGESAVRETERFLSVLVEELERESE